MRAALGALARSPLSWIAGAAGFLARGGLVALALPILSLPTPVGVTLLVPPIAVTTSGISASFIPELVALGVAACVVIVAALVLAATADAVAFDRLVEQGSGHAGVRHLRGIVARLVGVEIVALIPTVIAAVVAADNLIAVGEHEYLLPSSSAVPYVVRVLRGAWPSVTAVAACLLVSDLVNAVLSRAVLRRAFGWPRPEGARHASFARSAVRVAGTWAAAWLVTGVSLALAVAVVELAWPPARDAYTATMSAPGPAPVELAAATVGLVVAWIAAVLIAGLGSSIRTLLWSFGTIP